MMDKNPDTRTPTAAAVVELLRPWCDESATRQLAESSPGSGILYRGGAPAPPTSAALDETASFVLDDMDFVPGQVESPSQISQGTVSVAAEMEDTLPGVQAPRRAPAARTAPPLSVGAPATRWWPKIVFAVVVLGAVVAVAAWWMGLFH
ncbi:MAG: hypothetical protein ACREMY_29840, partial [bacterium]